MNRNIIGVGCAAHILHNTIQTASDLLPADVENITAKIYSYFYIYTVRVESLKDFCESAEIEYKRILGYSKTRWLALLSAVQNILKIYEPLKSYFLSQDRCPRILQPFFENDTSQIWLQFIHNQATLFNNDVKIIDGNKISIVEVSNEVNNLKTKLREKTDDDYVPLVIRKDVTRLEEQDAIKRPNFVKEVRNFYNNCLEYREEWIVQFEDIKNFYWVTLKNEILWEYVQESFKYILVAISQKIIFAKMIFLMRCHL